jgi:hypothetical protein
MKVVIKSINDEDVAFLEKAGKGKPPTVVISFGKAVCEVDRLEFEKMAHAFYENSYEEVF